MPGPTNTLLIEGSFEELADELAHYIDEIRKKQGDDGQGIQAEITPLLEQGQKNEALKKIVTGSAVLNAAPEKEFIAAYNLLVHLVRQSPDLDKFLPKICQNLSAPITSSPSNGPGLALSVLTTIFNILPPDNDVRYHVFLAVLRVVRGSASFETLKSQLKNLESWIAQWETDEEDQRKLYLSIADVAEEAGEDEQAYLYLLRALRTVPTEEADSDEARTLSIRALKSALSHPAHFDFQDLTALDSIQALRKSDPVFFELLEIFNADVLDDYNDFQETHDGWVEEQGLDRSILYRKMRLLTLASLAASTQSRALPYQHIAKALQIPDEDVEMWVIDIIRAGLVEGKLSQLNQTFLIHRSTYRVFGEKQWQEVQGRLDTWRSSLEGVLAVVRAEREKVIREKERELREVEGRLNGNTGMGGVRRGQREIDMGVD
ncbi:MAG: eukaryotic translation initiation factor 3 subunit M [Lasallia pustulata]|uniref:Eukaryotic translation initiation factor 3 subunit M n=1 Tax=Lasallia pustulata TaxID=136370 RepID=A0A5M8PT34_9LECA|nr:MAG: eukaryotic translation initiation factor 3 subunit M [Lasallia pustulata]